MSEEKVTTEATAGKDAKVSKTRIWPIVLSVAFVCLTAGFTAFLHWHEEPSFCSTICHTNMQKYVDGYYSEDDTLLVAKHAEADVTCLGCHWSQAKMMDLVHEVVVYVTNTYPDPLHDMREFNNDEFCGACHNGVEAPTKEEATAGLAIDPHNIPAVAGHEGVSMECGDCHAVHKTSTMVCASCHDDAVVPENWTAPEKSTEKAAASVAMGIYDGHNTALLSMEAHANADLSCSSCHENNVMVCATCHANVISEQSIPVNWDLPEVRVDATESHVGAVSVDQCAVCHTDSAAIEASMAAASEAMGAWDGHNFSQNEAHVAANITCDSCHASNVMFCATCHAGMITEENLAEGWTLPEVGVNVFADHSSDVPMDQCGTCHDGSFAIDLSGVMAAVSEGYTWNDNPFDFHNLTPEVVEAHAAFIPEGLSCSSCHAEKTVANCSGCHRGTFVGTVEGWEGFEAPAAEEKPAAAAASGEMKDGTYEASAKGLGGDVPVTVEVKGGKIVSVEVGENSETQGIGTKAIDALPEAIVEANGIEGVDAVSGATVTSKAIFKAVEDCMAQAQA